MALVPFPTPISSDPSPKCSCAQGLCLPPTQQAKLNDLVSRFRALAHRSPVLANVVLEIGDWVLRSYGA